MKTLLAASVALTLGTATYAEAYKIDSEGAHASINFETSHLGYSFVTGRFDTFSGNIEYDAANIGSGSVAVEIDLGSVNTNHAKRDNHLRSGDFFDTANHATGSFVSTGIKVTGDKTAVITGDLTLRGITNSVDLDARFIGEGDDPWGGYRVGFTGATMIQLKDYDMGGVIGDAAIKITVHAEGIRQ